MRCDTYAAGNCTEGACELAAWVPEGLGDGGDWAANWQARGGQVTLTPTACAVVCYCRGDGYSPFGHVALVEEVYADGSFLVKEENFVAFATFDERVSNQGDVCGFLLPPGVAPGQLGTCKPGQGGPPQVPAVPGTLVDAWEAVRWWTWQGHNYEWWRQTGTEQARSLIPI